MAIVAIFLIAFYTAGIIHLNQSRQAQEQNPQNVRATRGTEPISVTLHWTPVPDTAFYRIGWASNTQ